MDPRWLAEVRETLACGRHVLLELNTEDRFYLPGGDIPPANLPYFLAQVFGREGFRVAQYLPSLGLAELAPNGRPASDSLRGLTGQTEPLAVFNGISRLLRNDREKWLFLIHYLERLAPAQAAGMGGGNGDGLPLAEIIHLLALDDEVAATPSRIVGVAYAGRPDELLVRCRGLRVIEIGLPGLEERRGFLEFLAGLAQEGDDGFGRLDQGLALEEAARLTAGLPLYGLEAVFRMAGYRQEPVGREALRLAKAREIRELARDLLEVRESDYGFEGVAGLATAKTFFRGIIQAIQAGRPDVPQSILLQGVPGCGKSHFVLALGQELGWPVIQLRSLRSMWQGESERNLERAIHLIDQLSPAVVFLDEIDQSLGQRGTGPSGDSGTSERLLSRVMEWLGGLSHRGRTLFVAATNRPDLLDPAILDRFGVALPFLKPGPEEIRGLVPLLLQKFGRELGDLDLEAGIEMLSALSVTGRDLQEILVSAGLKADAAKKSLGATIDQAHLAQAVADHLGREDPVEMEFLGLTALALASRQSLLPWNGPEGLREGAQVPERLIELGVVDPSGRLDPVRLHQVLGQLQEQRFSQRLRR